MSKKCEEALLGCQRSWNPAAIHRLSSRPKPNHTDKTWRIWWRLHLDCVWTHVGWWEGTIVGILTHQSEKRCWQILSKSFVLFLFCKDTTCELDWWARPLELSWWQKLHNHRELPPLKIWRNKLSRESLPSRVWMSTNKITKKGNRSMKIVYWVFLTTSSSL